MRRVYLWDTSVFLTWIRGESRGQERDLALAAAVEDVDTGRAAIVASVMIFCEMLESHLRDEEPRQRFADVFRRPNMQLVEVSSAIARRAGQIRDSCRALGIVCPRSEDAIHVATAVVYGVSELHTFDEHQLKPMVRCLW